MLVKEMKAFECVTCGECCYGEGGIFLEKGEPDRIAGYLGVSSEVFVSESCEKSHGKLYIRTGPDGYCLFYDKEKSCLIHPVKPDRCCLWPFFPAIVNDRETWEMAKEACPGINPGCPFEDFVKQADQK
jgi:uncharacterized protein